MERGPWAVGGCIRQTDIFKCYKTASQWEVSVVLSQKPSQLPKGRAFTAYNKPIICSTNVYYISTVWTPSGACDLVVSDHVFRVWSRQGNKQPEKLNTSVSYNCPEEIIQSKDRHNLWCVCLVKWNLFVMTVVR